jgi:hypothetical protein
VAGTKKPVKKYNSSRRSIPKTQWIIDSKPLTFDELFYLKSVPHLSLQFLQNDKAEKVDWYNVYFCILVGMWFCEMLYSDENHAEFKKAIRILNNVRTSYLESGVFCITKEEAECLSATMWAVDEMREDVNRGIQLTVHRKALQYIQKTFHDKDDKLQK